MLEIIVNRKFPSSNYKHLRFHLCPIADTLDFVCPKLLFYIAIPAMRTLRHALQRVDIFYTRCPSEVSVCVCGCMLVLMSVFVRACVRIIWFFASNCASVGRFFGLWPPAWTSRGLAQLRDRYHTRSVFVFALHLAAFCTIRVENKVGYVHSFKSNNFETLTANNYIGNINSVCLVELTLCWVVAPRVAVLTTLFSKLPSVLNKFISSFIGRVR